MNNFTPIAERPGHYAVPATVTEADILAMASYLIDQKLFKRGQALTSPDVTRRHLRIKYSALEHEVFGMILLDSQHRIIREQVLFNGTIDGASVCPREVVKAVLADNAAAVIFFHNHPSGLPEPSQADKAITARLQQALALIDVRVLDHFIIGALETTSFAERGLL